MRHSRDARTSEEQVNNTANPTLEPGNRNLPVAREIETIDQYGYPTVEEKGAVRRNLVRARGSGNLPGAWSMAMPGIIGGSDTSPELYVLNNLGREDGNFLPFVRWQLPDGSKDILPGTTGVIVAGTDLDEDRVIFHPDPSVGLRINHRSAIRPAGQSIVFGTDVNGEIGNASGLSTAFFDIELPQELGGVPIVSLNAMSLEDENLDGNLAMIFNKAAKYANQIGDRFLALGVWNRNGPFAVDATNSTELGRNGEGIPVRALMLDYRTAKFGNAEGFIDGPAPLCFDDSRYAYESEPVGWSLSGKGGDVGADRPGGGATLKAPFFGKGCFFLNPNKRHLYYDEDGVETFGLGVWEIEVEEHIIAPQTASPGGGGQGQVSNPSPSQGGQQGGGGGGGGGGQGGGQGGGGPGPGGRGPGGRGGGPDPDNKKPGPKLQGPHGGKNRNLAKKKCKSKLNREGGSGDVGEGIGPPPEGFPDAIWRRIAALRRQIAKADARGMPKTAHRLRGALAKIRAKGEKLRKRRAARDERIARIKKYGVTGTRNQARVAGRRAVAAEMARRRAACEKPLSRAEKKSIRDSAEAAAYAELSGNKPAGAQKDQGPKGSDAPKGNGAVQDGSPSIQDELDRKRAAEFKEAEKLKGKARDKKIEEIARKYRRIRSRLRGRMRLRGIGKQIGQDVAERARKANTRVKTGGPYTGDSFESKARARRAAGSGSILGSLSAEKMHLPGIDFYAQTEAMRRDNVCAAGDSRSPEEYVAIGNAPSAVCLNPISGAAYYSRPIKRLAAISALVFGAADVDPCSTGDSSVVAAVVFRPEAPLYIGATPVEGARADEVGEAAVDGWKVSRGTQTGDPTVDALVVDCLDDDGNHDSSKIVEVRNDTHFTADIYDKNGDEVLGSGGGGASDFTDLGDVPGSYSGEADKLVRVNAAENGLEFVDNIILGFLEAADNLSDLDNAATARTNLGLGGLATQDDVNNSDWNGTDLSIANGGTGASDGDDAFRNIVNDATEDTSGAAADFVMVRTAGNAGRKMQISNLLKAISELIDHGQVNYDDELVIYEQGASEARRVAFGDLNPTGENLVMNVVEYTGSGSSGKTVTLTGINRAHAIIIVCTTYTGTAYPSHLYSDGGTGTITRRASNGGDAADTSLNAPAAGSAQTLTINTTSNDLNRNANTYKALVIGTAV